MFLLKRDDLASPFAFKNIQVSIKALLQAKTPFLQSHLTQYPESRLIRLWVDPHSIFIDNAPWVPIDVHHMNKHWSDATHDVAATARAVDLH